MQGSRSVPAEAQPAAGEEEAEENEKREDAPKVVQERQRWCGIATWCSVPGPELSPRSSRDRSLTNTANTLK